MLLRNKRTVLGFALTGLAAVMLTVPATAFAGDESRRDRTDHRDDDGRRGDDHGRAGHRDGDHANHRRYASYTGHNESYKYRYNNHRPAHSYRHASAKKHGSPFYCKPCNHRFESRVGFNNHLGGHHHIAPWRLPFVVVHHTLGWVFFG